MAEKDKWSKGIKQEIIDMKLEITALKAQMKALGAPIPSVKDTAGSGSKSDKFFQGIYDDYTQSTVDDLTDQITGKGTKPDYLEGMVKASYSIREASTAMRGYLMLLDQAGLSKEQKKMVRDLENGMMAIMKASAAIKYFLEVKKMMDIAALAGTGLGPMGIMYTVLAGGSLAASLAFGNKLSGGGV